MWASAPKLRLPRQNCIYRPSPSSYRPKIWSYASNSMYRGLFLSIYLKIRKYKNLAIVWLKRLAPSKLRSSSYDKSTSTPTSSCFLYLVRSSPVCTELSKALALFLVNRMIRPQWCGITLAIYGLLRFCIHAIIKSYPKIHKYLMKFIYDSDTIQSNANEKQS